MTRKAENTVKTLNNDYPDMAAAIIRRQQQREQTLAWISTNALSAVRSAWQSA